MNLNLGCGFNKLEGYVNVDKSKLCLPDVLLTLDKDVWPWEDGSVDEVVLDHVLEHLGETVDQYFHVMRELYRVCKAGAVVKISVPHPRHDCFITDPTHVRTITPAGLAMFSRERNLSDIANGGKETPLGLSLDVDFAVSSVQYQLEPRWEVQVRNGVMSDEEMLRIMGTQNNVCIEMKIELTVIKEGTDEVDQN